MMARIGRTNRLNKNEEFYSVISWKSGRWAAYVSILTERDCEND
jgi:hypothetical protein